MKKITGIVQMLSGLFLISACQPELAITPSFEVSTSKSIYQQGDVIEFSFQGNSDFITFYPGTPGKEYGGANPLNGTPLKNMTTRLENYAFIYDTPGDYTATFVAATSNVYGKSEVVRTISLKINPLP